MKFEVDTFRKKEVIKKKNFFHENSKFNGGNSDKFYARVENLVTYDVMCLMTRNLYLKFEENILKK
jgi:hypothetical protein